MQHQGFLFDYPAGNFFITDEKKKHAKIYSNSFLCFFQKVAIGSLKPFYQAKIAT